DRLVRGDAGAGQRRGLVRRDVLRHGHDEVRVRDGVFGVGAVDGVAAVGLGLAERLPAGDAVAAVPAGGPEPGDGDPVADAAGVDPVADGLDDADALVAGDGRKGRLDR